MTKFGSFCCSSQAALRRLLWLTAATAMLAGCASPIMRIDAPGYSVAKSTAPSAVPTNMADAVNKLEYFRAIYYEAIVDRAQTQQSSTTGLVWLGAALAAMAAGSVHRDAILGVALIGGTTYGLSRTQLDARHVQVWNQGIKALNCAREASLPMDIGKERYEALAMATKGLASKRAQVASLRDETAASASLMRAHSAAQAASVFELLAKVDDLLVEADRTGSAANALLQLASGAELAVTVDKIHAKVTEAMSDLLVDVSAVPQLIAGLGGFASTFTPGVDVGAILLEANKRAGLTTHSLGGKDGTEKLQQQVDALKSAMESLRSAHQQVSAMLISVDRAAVVAALKACEVAGVSTAVVLYPATLQFTAGVADAKGFQISGGKAPYTVAMLDNPPDWLTRDFSGGLADTAQIKVTDKAVAGLSFNLLVSDSSPTRKSRILTVGIVSKPELKDPAAGSTGAGIATSAATDKSHFEALAKAMAAKWKTDAMEVVGLKLLVTKAEVAADGKGITVAFTCDKKPANGWSNANRNRIAEQLTLADGNKSKELPMSKAFDAEFSQVKLQPDPATCGTTKP